MHARRRSPGNGYRSNSMGLGAGASGVSSDNSGRGRGYYNSEYRSFNNRGFGRGQAGRYKSFQQPPQPPAVPQRGDILMEAGRLAAEYLVSKGLLPPNSLPGRWQNGSFRKQVGEYQEFRQQEDVPPDSRASGFARAGSNSGFDTGTGRRRYSDDFNSGNQIRGRRRGEYYRSHSSEWSREYGRSGSWSDRNRVSPDTEGENDATSRNYVNNQYVDAVIDEREKSASSTMEPGPMESASIEPGPEENNLTGDLDPKESLSNVKDKTGELHIKVSGDLKSINLERAHENNEIEKQAEPDNIPSEEFDINSKVRSETITDLAEFCKFSKVPTKMRSALTSRNYKVERSLNDEEQKNSNYQLPGGPEDLADDATLEISAAGTVSCDTAQGHMHVSSDVTREEPDQSAKDGCGMELGGTQGKNLSLQSSPGETSMHDSEHEPSNRLTTFGRSTSVEGRGEKRTADDYNVNVAAKKPREWLSSLVMEAETQMPLSNLPENTVGHHALREYPDQQVIPAVTQGSLAHGFHFPQTDLDPYPKYAQEKQLFPSSFKICDLNLMEASNVNESRHGDAGVMYPPVMNIKSEAMPVDVGLSISNSNVGSEYGRHTRYGKEIEVIDLDADSPEHREFDKPQEKLESAFAATEGLPNHGRGAGSITDVQDNYDGLTISEFLETFSNCASGTEDITPLENAMGGLHGGEGTLGDDDSIYMSLDEIPLSFIPAWQQPTPQEYEKPF